MITFLVATIQGVADIAFYAYITAALVGKLILTVLTTLTSTVVTIFENTVLFLEILYKDNVFTITEELPNIAFDFMKLVIDQITKVKLFITSIPWEVFRLLDFTGVNKFFTTAFKIILEVLKLCKSTFIFIGDTVWFIVTFIPMQLPLLVKEVTYHLASCMKQVTIATYMKALQLTNFLTDVPLQSFTGLISAIIIIRLYINYRVTIHNKLVLLYYYFIRRIVYLYYALYSYFRDSEMRLISRMTPAEQLASASHMIEDEDPGDTLCVICRERQKTVLTLPCRHVCLCRDCCICLYDYQRTCPICRTFIYHSVNVYL